MSDLPMTNLVTITAPAGTAPAGTQADPPPVDEKKFSQSEVDAILKDRLARERRAAEATQREKEQAAETQRLEDQKEFEKLAQQRAKEIDGLKPRATLAEGYEKKVSQLMSEAAKALPGNIQMLLNKLSLPDQLDWLTENLDSVRTPPVTTGATDINAWSRTTGGSPALTDEEYKRRKRQESIYK